MHLSDSGGIAGLGLGYTCRAVISDARGPRLTLCPSSAAGRSVQVESTVVGEGRTASNMGALGAAIARYLLEREDAVDDSRHLFYRHRFLVVQPPLAASGVDLAGEGAAAAGWRFSSAATPRVQQLHQREPRLVGR